MFIFPVNVPQVLISRQKLVNYIGASLIWIFKFH